MFSYVMEKDHSLGLAERTPTTFVFQVLREQVQQGPQEGIGIFQLTM